ncbi:ATP-binding protein, partial [Kibdelosporangium lantanae]
GLSRRPDAVSITSGHPRDIHLEAAVAQSGFTLNTGNGMTVVRICQRLEGIPLAIELVAPRVRAMPMTEILSGLDDYLEFLTTGSQIAVPRLQPLRAALDWSFALCTPMERQLWARVSVFAGAFDIDAAESVCCGQDLPREDVFALVAALVDKSVLTQTHDEADTVVRYRMLEPLRHYGREQLDSSLYLKAVRVRHRDHYRDLVTRSEQEWLGPNESTWFTRLRHEHANLRAALEFCLTQPGQARAGLQITTALWQQMIPRLGMVTGVWLLWPLTTSGKKKTDA